MLLFFVSYIGQVNSQNHSPCGPSPVPLSEDCSGACVVCDLNGVSARTTNGVQGQSPPGYCTMVVHSMQWLAFVAGSPNLSINVAVSGCTQNNGVEMGIYASMDCSSFNLVSNCNTNMFNNQTWPFTTTTALKPGCVYYLVWDGNGPNSCNVSMTVTAGSTRAPVPNTSGPITGKTLVCAGESASYQIDEIFGACEYEWRVENGSILRENGNQVDVLWDSPGTGKICVKGKNVCHEGNEVCLDVLIGDDSPPTDLGPFYVCPGQFHRIGSQNFGAGITTIPYKNIYGCDSLVHVIVEEILIEDGLLDTTICWPGKLNIGTISIDSSTQFIHRTKSRISPFCDSLVFIDLKIVRLQPVLNKSSDLSCKDTLVLLFVDSTRTDFKDIKNYAWLDPAGDTIAINQNAKVLHPGEYQFVVFSRDSLDFKCPGVFSIQLNGSRKIPELVLEDSIKQCPGEWLTLDSFPIRDLQNSGATLSFHFAQPCDSSNLIPSDTILIDRDSVVFVKASNGICIDELKVPIFLIPKTVVSIPELKICKADTLWFDQININHTGPAPLGINFYSCQDSSCLISQGYWIGHSDTMIWLLPTGVPCPEWSSFAVDVLSISDPDVMIERKLLCTGTALKVKWNTDQNVNYFFQVDTAEAFLISSGFLDSVIAKKGMVNFCLLAQLEHCQIQYCDSIEIRDPPDAPAGYCFSTDSSVSFFWKKDPNFICEVFNLSGQTQAIQTSDSSYYFSGLARGEEALIRVVLRDSLCGDQSIELKCSAIDCPDRNIVQQPPRLICMGDVSDTIHLNPSLDKGPELGRWTFRGTGIRDSSSAVFDLQLAGPGIHTIQISYLEAGCIYSGQQVVVVRRNPLAKFVLDSAICQDSFLLIRFTGRKEDSTMGQWQLDGGFFRPLGKDLFEVKWDKPGKKKIRLRLPEEFCLDEQEQETEVFAPLELPEIQCYATDTSISFYWKKNPRAKNYLITQLKGPNGYQTSDTSFHISVQQPGDTAELRVRILDQGPCGEVESEAVLCSTPLCPPIRLTLDTVIRLCSKQITVLSIHPFLVDSTLPISISGPQLSGHLIHFDRMEEGIHTYHIQYKNGNCAYRDSIQLSKMGVPQINEISFVPIPCSDTDSTGIISVDEIRSGRPPYQFSLNGIPFFFANRFSNLPAGDYQISVVDSNGCKTDTMIQLIAPQKVSIDLGPDLDVLKGTLIEIRSDILGPYSRLMWTGLSPSYCDTCRILRLTAESDLILVAHISNDDGCMDEDEIRIKVRDKNIYAPNTFSPNGDGVNDGFILYGPDETARIRSLEIYDRWGAELFHAENLPLNDPKNGWNGEFNGQKIIPGVYVYTARVIFDDGSVSIFKGSLTLVR
ncbi:MAG: gliding motility-associated C-terminal domain-containing protein [Saprospiraceae bacterium]|nr:gliding motility-associated C-terminal domain-containing protein [Saprospiraceae bacterium]